MGQADSVPTTKPSYSPLNAALIAAGTQLLSLRAHRIVGEPDRHAADQLIVGLWRIADIIDRVIAAIGSYASHHFGWIDPALFKNPLFGNQATFAIEEAGDNYMLEQWGRR